MEDLHIRIAAELQLRPEQIARTLELAADGATVPFIARYRKEVTGNLDEVQIQAILDRADDLRQLEERRAAITKSIDEQGKMTPELAASIANAKSRSELEDFYLPYRPRRRTRATIAKERGLEPLAAVIWGAADDDASREEIVARFISPEKEVADSEIALAGARDICAEWMSEDAHLRKWARAVCKGKGSIRSDVVKDKREVKSKFEMYYSWEEPILLAPSHRILAMFRGETEEYLSIHLRFPEEEIVRGLKSKHVVATRAAALFEDDRMAATEDGWKRLLSPQLDVELRTELKERADHEAIDVFGQNLRNLLLAAPAGTVRIVALDPGLRTGIKTAAIDHTGRLLETATLYTERSSAERDAAAKTLRRLVENHKPDLIAVGNGTGNREAEEFVRSALAELSIKAPVVSVSEQGASIYSASAIAREEFPDLDLSLRSAMSIGRRLQDPLAELVKIDPKSIGVGQYQHDVNQPALKKKLGEVVDSCVNAVGVDANTASPELLEHVSGIGPVLAKRIVAHRNDNGSFTARQKLREVRGLGPHAFEQCAGFMRIRGENPLDNSAVHPERYNIVEQMARDLGVSVASLVGNANAADQIDWRSYIGGDIGEPTLRDIISELKKPGRDPRGTFEPPKFDESLKTIGDLRTGMVLEGVVTNVTAFGAFVDIGVHQDGLVHVSQLAKKFVKDPTTVAKVGDRLKVKVIAVDIDRKRIGLSAKDV